MNNIQFDWNLFFRSIEEQHRFKAGICIYTPNNGIDWYDTDAIAGISSFENLGKELSKTGHYSQVVISNSMICEGESNKTHL